MVVSSTNITFPVTKTLVRSTPSAGVEFDADEPVARRPGEVGHDALIDLRRLGAPGVDCGGVIGPVVADPEECSSPRIAGAIHR
jgi:hypothetical protein